MQNITNQQLSVKGSSNALASSFSTADIKTIADLHSFVKRDFSLNDSEGKTFKAEGNITKTPLEVVMEKAEVKAIEAAFGAGKQNVPREKVNLATLEQLESAESLWKEAYRASELMAKNNSKTKSLKGLENKAGQEYNGDIRHSLKWHTGLTKGQIEELLQDIKYEVKSSQNYITDGAKWIFSDIGGTDVFAIYSTDNAKDPTVLYASKGKKAEVEKNRLLEILEEYENGKNTDRTSKASNEVFSGNWTQQAHGMAGGGNGLPGSKSGVGNATVLQGKPSANGSRAFRNVIESLFKISSEGRGGRDGISYSLKGGAAKKTGTSNVYSNRNGFDETYNSWIADGKPDRKVLVVGKTSGALKSIGVKEQGITWDTSKINKSLRKHSYLDDEILKSIPALIEYPIIVMQSKQSNSRITMFGEVYDKDGLPIMAVLELQPLKDKSGIVLDEIKIVSAHSRKNKIPTDVTQTQRMIDTSDILYIEPNKKRTDSWLMRTRLQLPFGITNYGSIKSVTYPNGNVNTYSMQNGEKDSDVSYSLKGESQIMRDYDLMKRGEYKNRHFKSAFLLEKFFPLVYNLYINSKS